MFVQIAADGTVNGTLDCRSKYGKTRQFFIVAYYSAIDCIGNTCMLVGFSRTVG